MANYDLASLAATTESAKTALASAKTAADVQSSVCSVWSKVRKFVVIAESFPVVGNFIKMLADVLDALCKVQS